MIALTSILANMDSFLPGAQVLFLPPKKLNDQTMDNVFCRVGKVCAGARGLTKPDAMDELQGR
jgi:hypothetical protein